MIDLQLIVRHVPPESAVPVGQRWPALGDCVIGRSPDVEIMLADRTVSRRHARIERVGAAWQITNLSRANGVFIDGQPLASGGSAPLPCGVDLQVGGLILRVDALEETVPVTDPITTVATPPPEPLLIIRRDGDACTVHCRGRFVPMPPVAALVLYALARQPGAVVHEWDIQDVVGRPCHIPQAISAIRRALRGLVADGLISAEELAKLAALAHADSLEATDLGALSRQIVRARRKHGYALMLPSTRVQAEVEG